MYIQVTHTMIPHSRVMTSMKILLLIRIITILRLAYRNKAAIFTKVLATSSMVLLPNCFISNKHSKYSDTEATPAPIQQRRPSARQELPPPPASTNRPVRSLLHAIYISKVRKTRSFELQSAKLRMVFNEAIVQDCKLWLKIVEFERFSTVWRYSNNQIFLDWRRKIIVWSLQNRIRPQREKYRADFS